MIAQEWDWPLVPSHQKHSERVALMRPIPYEITSSIDEEPRVVARQGKALSLNISSEGMLVIMEHCPDVDQVLKVHVPTPLVLAETPTLAEVRWVRYVPFRGRNGSEAYFVGLKFLF